VAWTAIAFFVAVPVQAATPTWAPAASASIHAGVTTITGRNLCTSNFVFTDAKGDIFLGQAAHCASLGESTNTDGCATPALPVGTQVTIEGGTAPGVIVYNSWRTMQARGETDANTCRYNDLALVRINRRDYDKVNPSVPHWGGPTGIARSTNRGDRVVTFGATPLLQGVNELKPRLGLSRGQTAGGWNHTVLILVPGIPGDSGGGILDSQGRALGVLSTLNILPQPLTNGVSDLFLSLNYANHFGKLSEVVLANGTEPFNTAALANLDATVSLLDAPLSLLELVLDLLQLR
jgi:hypothetical protein